MLRYIYTFFVGLAVAVFIGTGVAVFYPAPEPPQEPISYGMQKTLSEAEQKIESEYIIQQRQWQKNIKVYNRNASMILLSCAIIVLTVALVFSDRLSVVADGLLLGGIFTLIYGIIRGMDTDNSKYRFLVASVGLVVAIVLGYVKFARHQESRPIK